MRILSKSLSEFSTEKRNGLSRTHTRTGAYHYQCYCEEILIGELLLKELQSPDVKDRPRKRCAFVT